MFFSHLQEDDYVIKVDETIDEIQFSEAILHQPMECGWHVVQAKWHVIALKEA